MFQPRPNVLNNRLMRNTVIYVFYQLFHQHYIGKLRIIMFLLFTSVLLFNSFLRNFPCIPFNWLHVIRANTSDNEQWLDFHCIIVPIYRSDICIFSHSLEISHQSNPDSHNYFVKTKIRSLHNVMAFHSQLS